MRDRDRIVGSLEKVYRSAFDEADQAGDRDRMERLDFEFQRDQLYLEVLLDVRDLLELGPAEPGEEKRTLLDKAKALKDLTKLRPSL